MPKLSTVLASLLLLAASGCGDTKLKAQGEPCFGSSECEPGLVCDLGTCQTMLTPMPDANVVPQADATPPADAPPGTPDAMPQPDAAPGTPDAMITPDAPLPDAPLPPVDAALPDAQVFDAPL